eukprot:1987426-Pleurochrysis_carterae.AAC.2
MSYENVTVSRVGPELCIASSTSSCNGGSPLYTDNAAKPPTDPSILSAKRELRQHLAGRPAARSKSHDRLPRAKKRNQLRDGERGDRKLP